MKNQPEGDLNDIFAAQVRYCLIAVSQLAKNRFRVLAQRRNGVHAWRIRAWRPWWQQCRDTSDGRVDFRPAIAILQLEMVPQILHIIHASVANRSRVKSVNNLLRR